MEKHYFDNASTTFPKPQQVPEAVYQFMTNMGSNVNRGGYAQAYQTESFVYETRSLICELFHGENCKNVVFTKNVTESLNILLKGYLKSGDHLLVSSMEHNAVMRPLTQLKAQGVSFSRIACARDGTLCLEQMEGLLQRNTRAVVMTHASNVCGTILPIAQVGAWCKAHGLRFFVDAAQTAGVCPIDMEQMQIDALAFTGHKGLLGPQGIGGFLLREDLIGEISPLLSGGTGSISNQETVPEFMPDRFEAGTLNLPGILGLREGLLWISRTKREEILAHELCLTEHFLKGLLPLEKAGKLRIAGRRDLKERTGVVSIQTTEKDLSQVAFQLDNDYGIMTRVGLHCAPNAHKTLDTYPTGTIRFSFGWWNTPQEIELAICALTELL